MRLFAARIRNLVLGLMPQPPQEQSEQASSCKSVVTDNICAVPHMAILILQEVAETLESELEGMPLLSRK